MRSLAELNKEAGEIQLEIRRLLLNKYDINDGIADKLTVISTINTLRDRLMRVQREIRERTPDQDQY